MKKLPMNYDNPWIALNCVSLLNIITTILTNLKKTSLSLKFSVWPMALSMTMMILLMLMWFRDSARESLIESNDSKLHNSKMAVLLFLLTEAFFFLSFFWMFTSTVLAPELSFWPPMNLSLPSFIGAPSLNTILLVASSATVTLSIHEKYSTYPLSLIWLATTLVLSLFFMVIQYMEYTTLTFNFTSGIGGSIFFMATGFHGTHVILGTLILLSCTYLMYMKFYTNNSLMSFELAAWYWHFVDAVWLMLYTIFYCWGH
uniref:Cytochrome c oxidase subunit 3 n=1 Tax=Trichuris rhinopiptheroxella TaxID=2282176 RepID=A0A346HH54_9BILA|nr:cytochrome c oxidase subunit 3 [Trichuris rhinopiptheroxella]